MSKVTKFLAASALVVVSLGVSGCQNVGAPAAPAKAPEAVVQDGMKKLAEVTSYGYDVNLVGDLKGPAGEKPQAVKFNMKLDGSVEMKDPKNPKLNLDLTGSMNADADGGSGQVSLKLNKDAFFVNLMKLEGTGTVQIPEDMKAQVVGKWWTMALPPTVLDELAKASPTGSDANMTDDQKKMKALVENTKFFKNVTFVNNEQVAGEATYHYTGELDKDAFQDFVAKASDLQGKTMTDADKADLKDAMNYFDFKGEMYVGQTSGVLNKMKGTLTFIANADKKTPSGTVTVDASLKDLNKEVTVDAPKDAQEIPASAFNGLPL